MPGVYRDTLGQYQTVWPRAGGGLRTSVQVWPHHLLPSALGPVDLQEPEQLSRWPPPTPRAFLHCPQGPLAFCAPAGRPGRGTISLRPTLQGLTCLRVGGTTVLLETAISFLPVLGFMDPKGLPEL